MTGLVKHDQDRSYCSSFIRIYLSFHLWRHSCTNMQDLRPFVPVETSLAPAVFCGVLKQRMYFDLDRGLALWRDVAQIVELTKLRISIRAFSNWNGDPLRSKVRSMVPFYGTHGKVLNCCLCQWCGTLSVVGNNPTSFRVCLERFSGLARPLLD